MLKRIISLLLTAVFLTVPIVAADDGKYEMPEEEFFLDMASTETFSDGFGITEQQYEALKNTVYTATRNCEASCNISSFSIPCNDTALMLLNSFVRKGDPETFHIDGISYNTTGSGSNKKISQLFFVYKMTKSVYDSMRAEAVASADVLLEGVEGNDALDDVKKALILHDRLAVLCEYDTEKYYAGTLTDNDWSMYGALVDRKCVCEGYTKAYSYLLDRVGIRNYYCDSSALGHIWNIVYIDGEKYHVDVTWDDPTYDITGYVQHEYFLCSTEKFLESHDANDFDTTPDSTLFDDAFWGDSRSSFVLQNNMIYYIDNTAKTFNSWVGDNRSVVRRLSGWWRSASGGYFATSFSCLSGDGTYLYYTLPDTIVRFDPETQTTSTMYTYTPESSNPYFAIYGIRAEDYTMTVDVYNTIQFTNTTKADYEFTIDYTLPDLRGDVNDDGKINSKDVTALKKFIAGFIEDVSLVCHNADMNADNKLNASDISAIKRFIAS